MGVGRKGLHPLPLSITVNDCLAMIPMVWITNLRHSNSLRQARVDWLSWLDEMPEIGSRATIA